MSDLKNDIEKYLAGELSPAEMHALEKKALGDPFLADALEGGSSIDPINFKADLQDLERRLQAGKKKDPKIIPLWRWSARIAAGLIVICITTYLINRLASDQTRRSELALNKTETDNTDTQKHSIPSTKSDSLQPSVHDQKMALNKVDDSDTQPPLVATKKAPQNNAPVANGAVEIVTDQPATDDMTMRKSEAEEAAPSLAPAVSSESEMISGNMKTDKKARADVASVNKPRAKTKIKIIRGKVTDAEDGSALPGVNVSVNGSDEGTVTDINGYYNLHLDDNARNLVFSFIGMQPTEIPITAGDSINAQLSPDYASLSEVVVVGYNATKEGEIKQDSENNFQLAEPVGGRKAFNQYLIEKAQYPQQAIDNNIEGKVTIQFTLEANGIMNDFKVIRGIGYGCDDEVIRLIKEGPKWIPTRRNDVSLKGKVKVRLKFVLPK